MPVLIDIGAHYGETLDEVLKPQYSFERIICIEPSIIAIKKLEKFRDTRIQIEKWAAWDSDGELVLHSAGSIGGSLFSDKRISSNNYEVIKTFDFKLFFEKTIVPNDQVYIKINVEGAEIKILKRIFECYNKNQIKSILLSIDAIKIPSLQNEIEDLHALLNKFDFPIRVRQEKDTNLATKLWLIDASCLTRQPTWIERVIYIFKIPRFRVLRKCGKAIIPQKAWLFLANKYGPNRVRKVKAAF